MEWWYNNSGLNMLKGVDGDDDNPIRLDDATIIHLLRTIPAARSSFNRVVPTMLEEEQERLQAIASGIAQFMMPDYKRVEDQFQARMNTEGIRTTGRFGGTRRGGNS